jgi:hypothetical protein
MTKSTETYEYSAISLEVLNEVKRTLCYTVITYLAFTGYDAALQANYLAVRRHIRGKRDPQLCLLAF